MPNKNLLNKIKRLREKTALPINQCRQALEDSAGNWEKAMAQLKKTAGVAVKDRERKNANSGLIDCYCHMGKIGVMVELTCESDFVSRNQKFKDLAHDLSLQIAAMAPETIDELLEQNFIKDESQVIREIFNQTVNALGEKINIKQFIRWSR